MYTLAELLNFAITTYTESCKQVDDREEQDINYENHIQGLDEEIRGLASNDDAQALHNFRTWAKDIRCEHIQLINKAVEVELAHISK